MTQQSTSDLAALRQALPATPIENRLGRAYEDERALPDYEGKRPVYWRSDYWWDHGEFHCHKTVKVGDAIDDGDETWCEVEDDSKAQVCAGFLICLENDGSPNQMMRIAERLGLYDPSKLRTDAPVYETIAEAISAHAKPSRRAKTANSPDR